MPYAIPIKNALHIHCCSLPRVTHHSDDMVFQLALREVVDVTPAQVLMQRHAHLPHLIGEGLMLAQEVNRLVIGVGDNRELTDQRQHEGGCHRLGRLQSVCRN